MASSHPTIIDVARRAGVSKSLVSLVMRGAPNVGVERRARVLAAAEELGYRPNAVARSLVRQRTNLFGILLSDLHNPYFTEVVDGIEESAFSAEYRALITTGGRQPTGEARAMDTLLQLRVDGLILAGTVLDSRSIRNAARTCPVVLVARATRAAGVDSVVNDDRAGAGMAVDHLRALGHTRITHVDGGVGAGAASRRSGFLGAMRRHGLERSARVVPGDFTEAGGAAGVKAVLVAGDLPTAVFVSNDLAAIGALHAFEDAGLAVPEDISLVGYDNTALAALGHIGLTTIDQPRHEMGRTGVELLLERVESGRTAPRHLVIAPRLVVRRTTAPTRG